MIRKKALGLALIAVLCCSNISCKQSTETSDNVSPTLEKCYQDSSLAELEIYLQTWNLKIRPVSQNELNYFSDPIKSIYQIYQSFYDPFELNKYCTIGRCPEVGSGLYQDVEYIIIQMKISYSIDFYGEHESIDNFRPPLDFDIPVLYLSDEYKQELDSFLDDQLHPGETWQRLDFLNQKLKIIPGHWFGWHYLTHPEIEWMYFNIAMDSATVFFRIVHEGGKARFKRESGVWNFIDSQLTWIE